MQCIIILIMIDIFDDIKDDTDNLLSRATLVQRIINTHVSCWNNISMYDVPLIKASTNGNIYMLTVNVYTLELTCIFLYELKRDNIRYYSQTFGSLIKKLVEVLDTAHII